jgi:hypothetical protein
VRKQFAYNFPGVLQLAEPKKFDFFSDAYYKCLLELGEVQQVLILSIAEVVKITQPEFQTQIITNYIDLFKTEEPKVIEKLLEQYLRIVSHILSDEEAKKNVGN